MLTGNDSLYVFRKTDFITVPFHVSLLSNGLKKTRKKIEL